MKNNKGITLLALIITIIVLVILAGIALNTLFGNNGILNNSKYATEQYTKSVEKEAIGMAFADLKMKLYTDDSITEITAELLQQRLSEAGYNVEVEDGENGNFVITFKNTGDQYEVASNGSIVGEDKTEVVQVALEITGNIECTGGETTIAVTVPTNTSAGATFIYHYKLEGGEEQTATSNSSTYTIEGLTVNNNYEVWVEAYNSYNTEHAVSEHVTVRTEYGPYITVPADFAYNGGTITGLNSNAESGVATMAKSGDRKVILVLPEYALDGETVITVLGNSAFNGCRNIIKATIHNSIITLGSNAFKNCTGLKEVYISKNIGNISVNYNQSSVDYGRFAPFYGCSSLTTVTFEPGIERIPNNLMRDCTGLENITIPNTVTSIGASAFQGCTKLDNLVISENVTSIEASAFQGCTKLDNLVIPGNVTTIGASAFRNCTTLKNLTLSEGIVTMNGADHSSGVFAGCVSIEEVTLPKSLVTLGGNAFNGCTGLKEVYIPKSIANVSVNYNQSTVDYGRFAPFYGCSSLTTITFESGIERIPNNIFRDCTGLENITIPNTVTSIGTSAFQGCTKLDNLVIPGNVTTIETSAFQSCTSLKNLTLSEGLAIMNGSDHSSGVFSGCVSLETVRLPNSLTKLGGNAFRGCTNLKEVHISKNIENISVDYSQSSVGYGLFAPFYGCSSLTTITFEEGIERIPNNLFRDCTSLENITIPNTVKAIGTNTFNSCKGLTSVTLPNSLITIDSYAFVNCTGLPRITLPNSLITIGTAALQGCTSLEEITIPNSVTSIGSTRTTGLCQGCTSLTSVTLGTGLTSIPANMFRNCTSLTNVYIPKNIVTTATCYEWPYATEYGPFKGCSGLRWEGVELETGTEKIAQYLFFGTGLTSVTIPSSVTEIGVSAFGSCNSLTTATFEGTRAQWNNITKGTGNDALYNIIQCSDD